MKIRKLMHNERKFLFTPFANVVVCARLSGNIKPDLLKATIKRLYKKHPLLASFISFDKNNTAYFEMNQNLEPIILYKDYSEENEIMEQMLGENIRQNQLKPFNILKGPLIRFLLIKFQNFSYLIVDSQHAICDGTSLSFLIRDILENYTSNNIPEKMLIPKKNTLEYINPQINLFKKYLMKIVIKIINMKWKKNSYKFSIEEYYRLFDAFYVQFKNNFVFVNIRPELSQIMTKKCRDHGVTINSAINHALFQTYQKIFGKFEKHERNIVFPYDVRSRHEPPLADVFSLLVGSVEIEGIDCTPENFWIKAKEFHEKAKKKMEESSIFLSALAFEWMDSGIVDVMTGFGLMADYGKKKNIISENYEKFAKDKDNIVRKLMSKFATSLPGFINTNLGKLNYPRQFNEIFVDQFYFIPPGIIGKPLVVGSVGFNEKINLVINFLTENASNTIEILDKLKLTILDAIKLMDLPLTIDNYISIDFSI